MEIRIADRKTGCQSPPFIIAEMSGNHNQSLECTLEQVFDVETFRYRKIQPGFLENLKLSAIRPETGLFWQIPPDRSFFSFLH